MASVATSPLVLALFFAFLAHECAGAKVPALFVFGDSTSDVGNNNYMPGDEAKANYLFYGIDLPGVNQPTGRFSNGYNGIDFLAMHMGFKESPRAYLSLPKIYNPFSWGVNYASGGSGILDTTGSIGSSITMTDQIKYFILTRHISMLLVGPIEADRLLSESIFLISSGGNDHFAFLQTSPDKNQTQVYIANFVATYGKHVKTLYDHGARKFALIDVGPIGCCPFARVSNPSGTGDCIAEWNQFTLLVNKAVKAHMSELSSTLHGMKYSVGSSYAVLSSIIANPQGIEVKRACCGSGKYRAEVRCNPNSTYCEDRRHYLFWDTLHPSQTTGRKVASLMYSGSLEYASPINFKELVEGHGSESEWVVEAIKQHYIYAEK